MVRYLIEKATYICSQYIHVVIGDYYSDIVTERKPEDTQMKLFTLILATLLCASAVGKMDRKY